MEMESALEILPFLFLLQYVQVDTKVTEMETVLSHLSQLCVTLDLLVTDKEAAFQQLFQHHQLAQVDISQMDKETVFQIRTQK